MKKVLTFLVLSCSLLTSYAQSDDFGFDFSVGAEKKLRPGTHVSLEGGVRTMDHTKKVDRWTVGVGADQRLFDNGIFDLKVGLKWEYMWINYPEQTKDKTENYEYEHVVLDENDEPYSYYTDDYMGYNHRH